MSMVQLLCNFFPEMMLPTCCHDFFTTRVWGGILILQNRWFHFQVKIFSPRHYLRNPVFPMIFKTLTGEGPDVPDFPGTVPISGGLSPAGAVPGNVPV